MAANVAVVATTTGWAQTGVAIDNKALTAYEVRTLVASWAEACGRGDEYDRVWHEERLAQAGWFRPPGAPRPVVGEVRAADAPFPIAPSKPPATQPPADPAAAAPAETPAHRKGPMQVPSAAPAALSSLSLSPSLSTPAGAGATPAPAGVPPAPICRSCGAPAKKSTGQGAEELPPIVAPTSPTPAPASSSLELHRATAALAYVPIPSLEPPPEVRRKKGAPAPAPGELPQIIIDEIGAAWAGRMIASLDQLGEAVSVQRRAFKDQVDTAADEALRRVAEARRALTDAYGEDLEGFVRGSRQGRKKYVDLLSIRLALRAEGGQPERVDNPAEAKALLEFVEKHPDLGYDFIRRRPELEWGELKKALKKLGAKPGIDGRAVLERIDEHGELVVDVVPGVRIPPKKDRLVPQITGAQLAAPTETEEE